MNKGTIITDLISIFLPIISVYVVKFIESHVKNPKTLEVVLSLAKSAVTYAQKEGLERQLTGSEQYVEAVNKTNELLAKSGISKVDEDIIRAKVEEAYSSIKTQLDTYTTTTTTQGPTQ